MSKQHPRHPDTQKALEDRVLEIIRGSGMDSRDLLLEVHQFQREKCAPYRAFCQTRPQPQSWRDIPALPLSAFRHAAIRCFPVSEAVRSFHTSGTTGEGHGIHDLASLDLYRAAALTGWAQAGLPRRETFCLLPTANQVPHSSLSCMAAWLAPEENFFLGRWEQLANRLARPHDGPPLLFGTALAFLDFFQWLGTRRIELPEGTIAVETGGYKGTRRALSKAELYTLFENRLGLEPDAVWNEYGMTELSSQFYTRGLGKAHRSGPWAWGLVLDPETDKEVAVGATGLLRLFDLANVGSCCVLQTQDLAIRHEEGFELLGRDPAAIPRGCSRAADEMLDGSTAE